MKVFVGGTPPGEGKVDCSCDFAGRCDEHSAMMKEISDLYWHEGPTGSRDSRLLERVLQHADGYGEVGFVPDWSGVRDSSAYAVEQMHAELKRETS